jgi:predicted PurR-regulated permease PerM
MIGSQVLREEQPARQNDYINLAHEVFIRIGLLALLAVASLFLLRPFIPLIVWGIIIAIAAYPGYLRLNKTIGGREKLAAVLFTVLLLSAIVIPAVLLGKSVTEGVQSLVIHLKDGDIKIPHPPARIARWPLIGTSLTDLWELASNNLAAALNQFAPQIRARIPALLSVSAALGAGLLQFVASILLAGFLLANNQSNAKLIRLIFNRIFGDKGAEFQKLTGATIRSVTNGILGVALIQSFLASVGFLVVGLPAVGLWAVFFFVASVLQIAPLVLVPAVIYVFATTSNVTAVIFLVWCIIVSLMDNVLKPLLLSRGSMVPMLVIFLGVIGGFLLMGVIGLFVGAIILSVGYKLLMTWLNETRLPVGSLTVQGSGRSQAQRSS